MIMSALRASGFVGDRTPDLTVGAISCRRFAPLEPEPFESSLVLHGSDRGSPGLFT